jgi:hypothetical protein
MILAMIFVAYFSRMSNHYLRLAKASPHLPIHPMKYPIIADSGANYHMFKEKDFFSSLQPTSGTVLLGNGKSVINIEGVGTVKFYLGSHLVTLSNVHYIPFLGETIYSLFQHIKSLGHGSGSNSDQG